MDASEFNSCLKAIETSREAFEKIYVFYYKRIILHLKFTFGVTFAEDVAQEFFMKLIYLATLQPKVDYPTMWVYKCCENIAVRLLERQKEVLLDGELEIVDTGQLDRAELFGDLSTAIGQLSDRAQKIIYMHHWEGYGLIEISKLLKINYNTVKQTHTRALRKLQHILEDGDYEL